MDRLGSILPGVLHRRGLHKQAQASSAIINVTAWLTAALPLHAEALHPMVVRNGVLEIAFDNGLAAQECRGLQPDLLRYLQQSDLPNGFVREIRLLRAR